MSSGRVSALAKYLIAINVLEQATLMQLAEYLNLKLESVGRAIRQLQNPPDGSPPYVVQLTVANKLHQDRGNVPVVVALSEPGRRYLRQQNITVNARHAITDKSAKPHILAVNDVLVKALKLTREYPWLMLYAYKTEAELFANPMQISITPNQTVGLSPDLWLDFRGKHGGRKCYSIEVNLTPVAEKVWREKIRAYLNCVPAYTKLSCPPDAL